MNGRDDPRSVLKRAMGLEDDDKLHYGVRSQDVLSLFHYVVAQHAAEGRTVEFEWVKVGRNHSIKGQGWSGKDCLSTFMNAGCMYANSTLGTGLSISLNAVTNRLTVSHTSTSLLFVFDSTISPIIGMNSYMSLVSRYPYKESVFSIVL